MRSSATTAGGCFARSPSSFATLPVSISSRIFSAVLLPTPSIFCSSATVSLPRSDAVGRDRLRGALVRTHAERVRIALVEDRQLGELVQHVEHVLFRRRPRACFTSDKDNPRKSRLSHNADGEAQALAHSVRGRVRRARLRQPLSPHDAAPPDLDVADVRRDAERGAGPRVRHRRRDEVGHGRGQRPRRRPRHHQHGARTGHGQRRIDVVLDGAVARPSGRDAVADPRRRRRGRLPGRRSRRPEDRVDDDSARRDAPPLGRVPRLSLRGQRRAAEDHRLAPGRARAARADRDRRSGARRSALGDGARPDRRRLRRAEHGGVRAGVHHPRDRRGDLAGDAGGTDHVRPRLDLGPVPREQGTDCSPKHPGSRAWAGTRI